MRNRNDPKPTTMWGFYNYGRLHGVEGTRRDAIKAVEKHVGSPWSEAREFMEIHKVIVVAKTNPAAGEK